MPDLARFIGHKAGMQRALAEMDPGDEAVLVTRKDGVLNLYACGDAADSAVVVIGMLGWGQQECYHGEDAEDDGD